MIILKLKKLLLHLEYNLIDICYVATNEHQQKYDIQEKVKAEINDPIFNFKREFIAIQKSSEYFFETNNMNIIIPKIKKYCKYRVPFLSRIASMWQFGEAVEAKDFKMVERILDLTLSHTLTSTSPFFFYTIFDRHLVQAFKGSNKCF